MSTQSLKPGWKMVKFGDIAQNVAVRVDPADAKTDVYVGLEHLDPSTLHPRQWGHPSDVTGQKLTFKKGDVIFGRRRAYQRKLAVAEFDGICSAHAMVVRAKPKMILPEFLPFFLQSDMFMERAIEISVGSLSPTINWKTLKEQEFPLPPIDEQKRIAEILWAADEVLEKKSHSRFAFEVVESSSIDELISTALDKANGETQKLDDAVKITDCKHKTPKLIDAGIPMVAPGNISWGALQLAGCKQVSRDDYEMLMDHVDVNPMDLVLSRNQTYGIASYVESDTKFAIGQDTVLIQPKKISTKTAFLLLKSRFVQSQIERLCAGSTFKRINLGEIRKLLVPVIRGDIESRAVELFDIFEKTRRSLENDQKEFGIFRTNLLNNLVPKGRDHV